MLSLLPTSINSYSAGARSTVSSLIREMKIDKIELDNSIRRMNTFSAGTAFAAAQISPFSILDKQMLVELFRESYLKIRQFFSAMNSVGLALNSMVSIFTAEIEKLEKDIENLELYINNYEFISGKDDLYTFNYIEKFSDLLGEYRYDGSNFEIPDRDNSIFPIGGNGFIDKSIGAFRFGSSSTTHNIIRKIKSLTVASNYDNYVSSNSDVVNLFNEDLSDSWNVTIKSPTILTSSLSEYDKYLTYDTTPYSGARVAIELAFTEGISMDTIRISPNSSGDFQIMQVVVFESESDNGQTLLGEPKTLRAVREISFPKQVVNKVLFILNQQAYTRGRPVAIISELNSKLINSFTEERLAERRSIFSKYQDMVYWFFLRRTRFKNFAKIRNEYDFYSNKFPVEMDKFSGIISDEIFASSNFGLDFKFEATRSSALFNLIQSVFRNLAKDSKIIQSSYFIEGYGSSGLSQRLIDAAGFLYGGKSNNYYSLAEQFYNYPIVSAGVQSTVKALLANESQDVYEYLFSIKSIDFIETLNSSVNKASFVSHKIPTNNSQIMAIKAKMDPIESPAEKQILDKYDLKKFVSYELSVATTEVPYKESHWYPISFNDARQIESEVVFFDINDLSASLRFIPVSDSILLYRDGILTNQFRYVAASNKIYLNNKNLYSPNTIFCVKYDLDLIQYSPNEIDFVKENLFIDSVKTYGSASGEGQRFTKTDSRGGIALDYTPYVNVTLSLNSSYSVDYGTVFRSDSSGYSPVRVKLSNGTFAVNLTNYTGRAQDVQFGSSNSLAFIQNGKNIIFNRTIADPFTVYYDYIPNILRFRLIMRRNIPNLEIPAKVDNVLLKMKTFNFDPYYDKLNIGTSGR